MANTHLLSNSLLHSALCTSFFSGTVEIFQWPLLKPLTNLTLPLSIYSFDMDLSQGRLAEPVTLVANLSCKDIFLDASTLTKMIVQRISPWCMICMAD